MPVKRKLNKKRTKMPRNVKINQKSSKRASQKKRGRRASRRQRGGGGCLSDKLVGDPQKQTERENKINGYALVYSNCGDEATDEKNYCISSIIRELDEIFKAYHFSMWCSTKFTREKPGIGCYLRVPGNEIKFSEIKSDNSKLYLTGDPELTLEKFLDRYIRNYGKREYKNFYENLISESHLVCFYKDKTSKS